MATVYPTWYWLYLRHKYIKRSQLQCGVLPPDLYTRIVCRVFLGWKYVIVKPGHTPPPRGEVPESAAQRLLLGLAQRASHRKSKQPPSPGIDP